MYNPSNSQKSTLKSTCTKSHKTLVQFSYEVKWSNGIGRYTRGSIYAHDCMFLGERIFLCIGYFRFMCKYGGSESWYLVSKRQLLVLYLHYKHFPPGISLFGIDRNQRSMKWKCPSLCWTKFKSIANYVHKITFTFLVS